MREPGSLNPSKIWVPHPYRPSLAIGWDSISLGCPIPASFAGVGVLRLETRNLKLSWVPHPYRLILAIGWEPNSLRRGRQIRRLLRGVRMLVALINLQLREHGATQLGMRQHAFDRVFHHQRRLTVEALLVLLALDAAGVASVVIIGFLVRLQAGDLHLFGVDHDDVVPGIEEGRVLRTIFTSEDARHPRRQPAQGLARRIDNKPFTRNFPLREIRGHRELSRVEKNRERPAEFWARKRAGNL